MVDPLKSVGPGLRPRSVDPTQVRAPQVRPPQTASGSFKEMLAGAVTEVQQLQEEADTTIRKLVSGEIKDVAEALVAVERADMAFKTMMTVRGKVLSAYEDIMRMQV